MTSQGFSDEKQVRDLEQVLSDLQKVKLGSEDEAETLKLKRLFLTFKTKYQQALKELAQREQSQCSSQLSKKLEELQEENRALIQQQQALKEMLKKGQTPVTPAAPAPDNHRIEQLNQKLQQALNEKDRQIADLKHYELGFKRLSDENRKLEQLINSRGDGERQAMLDEIHMLKQQVEVLSSDNQQMLQQCEQQKHQTESLTTKELQLQTELNEQKDVNGKLRTDLDQMKESMVRGLREARELKQYYQNLINEKTSVLEKNTLIQRQLEELRAEIKRKDLVLDSTQAEVAAAKAEKQEVERLLDREKGEKAEREDNLGALGKQIQAIRSQLEQSERKAEEKEQEAVEAQQHLAKKVREASLLSEKVEEKHRTSERLQEEIVDYKMKLSESQALLEKEQDKAEHAAQQMEAVEKKYFRTHEKLQKVEAEVRELRKVEEKHQQMQQLLSNLGTVIGQPVGLTQPKGIVPEDVQEVVKPVETPVPKKKSSPKPKSKPIQDDLFDSSKQSSDYKKDLFE